MNDTKLALFIIFFMGIVWAVDLWYVNRAKKKALMELAADGMDEKSMDLLNESAEQPATETDTMHIIEGLNHKEHVE